MERFLTAQNINLEDDEFLKYTIRFYQASESIIPNQIITIRNINSIFVYGSEFFTNLLGIKPEQFIGLNVYQIYKSKAIERYAKADDEEIIQFRRTKTSTFFCRFADGFKPRTSIKYPIINPKTQNLVGILCLTYEFGVTASFSNNILKLFNSIYKTHTTSIKLSKREKQVIYFFLNNLSSNDIADALFQIDGKHIMKSTIDSIFNEQLYIKFGVNSRPALFDKLIELGYKQLIPQEVLLTDIVPVLETEIY